MTATASLRPQLVELLPADPGWLRLVEEAREATVFHLPAWSRVLADTYRYPTAVLAELDGAGHVVAGLPLARVRRLRGPAWVSLPFSDHCPPLAAGGTDVRRLTGEVAAWGQRRRVPVEVRDAVPGSAAWRQAAVGSRHLLGLEAPEAELRRGLSQTHRRRLRQAERSGLRVRFGTSGADLDAFYRLHVQTRRRQGVPVQPRRFFAALLRHVLAPGLGTVALAERPGGRPVAGAVVLAWNQTAIGKFQASDAESWDLRPNHLVYWEALRWASARGCRTFDFGRSELRHSGLQQWKAGWSAAAVPLVYSLTGGGAPATGGGGPLGAVLGLLIRRSPAVVCRAVGGLLYRYAA